MRDQRMLDLHDALRAFDFLLKTRHEAPVVEYFKTCQSIRDEPEYKQNKGATRKSEVSRPELEAGDGAPICRALLKLFEDNVDFVLPPPPPPPLCHPLHIFLCRDRPFIERCSQAESNFEIDWLMYV